MKMNCYRDEDRLLGQGRVSAWIWMSNCRNEGEVLLGAAAASKMSCGMQK